MDFTALRLAGDIVIPVIAIAGLSTWIIKRRVRDDSWGDVCLKLNPNHGLASHTLFWLAMLVPVFWFLALGVHAWGGHNILLSAEGYAEFIKISKLPIGLLSTSVPLTALITYMHSTGQTAKQIQKNEHEHFYMHRREFVSYFEGIESTKLYDICPVGYNVAPRVHGKLFKGEPKTGTPVLDVEKVDKLLGCLRNLERLLTDVFVESDAGVAARAYSEFCRSIIKVVYFFGARDVQMHLESQRYSLSLEGVSFDSIGYTGVQAFAVYECVRVYLTNTVYFAGYQKGIDEMEKLSISSQELNNLRLSAGMENKFSNVLASLRQVGP